MAMEDFWLDNDYRLCYYRYTKPNHIGGGCYKKYAQRRWAEYNLKKKQNYVDYDNGYIEVWYIAEENEPPFENVWNYNNRDFVAFLLKYHCKELQPKFFKRKVSETTEQVTEEKKIKKTKSVEHKFCYRVWVKSYYEGENADRVEEKFGMYERVFTDARVAAEYIKKVEIDLKSEGYHPLENIDKYYDCIVKNSTIVLDWNNVKMW